MEAAVERDEEFHAFVVLRGPALLRAAQYLTADRHLAEDLLQIALTKTYPGSTVDLERESLTWGGSVVGADGGW